MVTVNIGDFSNMAIKMIVSKNVNNNKCAAKLVFFNEKNEKDSDDFWHRKLTLKVKFWHFATPPNYLFLYPRTTP